jgi:NRPS condensation-like uncharacterized protein
MGVIAKARSLGIRLTVQDIMGSESIAELASKAAVPRPQVSEGPDKETESPFDLSPIQHMFFEIVGDEWRQFNQSMLLRVVKKVRPEMFIRAVNQLVTAHPMLRARFDRSNDGSWKQRISTDVSGSYRLLTHRTEQVQVETLIENSQKSLDIEHGPLIAFDLFDLLPGNDTLLSVVAHHL